MHYSFTYLALSIGEGSKTAIVFMLGDLLLLMASVCSALGTVISKKATQIAALIVEHKEPKR